MMTAAQSQTTTSGATHERDRGAAMKLGIVGLPNSGKTTLFNALTLGHAATSSYTAAQANRGVVSVPDERLDRLHERLETPKKVNATIEVVDIPGMGGGTPGEGLGLRFLADIRGVDAVAHVLRAFEDPDVPHVRPELDPIADADDVETELVLSDLELVERRLQKTGKAAKAGDKAAQKEVATLEKLAAALREGQRARSVEIAPDEEPLIRELALLTERPVLFVLNTGDEGGAPGDDLVAWAHARATRSSPSRPSSKPSWRSSIPTRRRSSAPTSATSRRGSTTSSPPRTACSATSPSSPATTSRRSRAPGSSPGAGTRARRRGVSTPTS